MDYSLKFWESAQLLIVFFFYIGVVAVFILMEKRLIEKRSRGEWILPAVLLIGALVLTLSTFSETSSTGPGLKHSQVFAGHVETGRVIQISHLDEGVIALGQYAQGRDEETRFIDLEVKEDRVIRTSIPISKAEKEAIEELFSYEKGKFTGKSVSYEALAAMDEAKALVKEKLTLQSVAYGMRMYGLPGLITLLMFLWSFIRRKRANAVMKSKLKDL